MDWPIAAVLLGVLGTVTAAIVKFVPQRTIMQNANGDKCATKEDVRAVMSAIETTNSYTHQRFHDLFNTLTPISHDLVVLLERTRGFRAKDDHK